MIYADILLPLAQDTYTFRIDPVIADRVRRGMCVKVQFGKSKYYTGIIWRLHDQPPQKGRVKNIDTIIEDAPVITAVQMRFWEWMAGYYMCTLGEVMRGALPSALKPEGFSHDEFRRDSYRPPTDKYLSLDSSIGNAERLNAVFESLKRAPKQYAALIEFADAAGEANIFTGEVPAKKLSAGREIIKALVKKKILSVSVREVKYSGPDPLPETLPQLTEAQSKAHDGIKTFFDEKQTVLLHGITGSGKTEIYVHLIAEQLEAGRNVMFLLPEIAMTSQLVARIREWFGNRVITYHSGLGPRERVEAYRTMAGSDGGRLILGVRSALLLPLPNPGLIIVDEEHDSSYKQNETQPRYHARDSAVMLGRLTGARVLLGSATPSIESWVNASEGKYGLVELTERYGDGRLPQVLVSDTLTAIKRGERRTHFNKLLLDKIKENLGAGRQVMLFQNRRGFSPYIECGGCGHVEMCPHCNVTLTFHKSENVLRCHYCGARVAPPAKCPGCGQAAMETRGFGTEKIEEELSRYFPDVTSARLDRDTARSRRAYDAIIDSFAAKRTHILIGTQMITKGFDFAGVGLVGIMNADNLLNYPDFRASERAFQIMSQVAGRAGRTDGTSQVVIQTSQPENRVVRQVAAHDYRSMVVTELAERYSFYYPPYCRLTAITLKHKDRNLLRDAAAAFAAAGHSHFGNSLLGPQPPAVDKIRGEYLLSFLLKVDKNASYAEAKKRLKTAAAMLTGDARFRYVDVAYNVDPQ